MPDLWRRQSGGLLPSAIARTEQTERRLVQESRSTCRLNSPHAQHLVSYDEIGMVGE